MIQPDLQMFRLKLNKYEFHPLEVVGRGSDTQLQVGDNGKHYQKTSNCVNSYCCHGCHTPINTHVINTFTAHK